MEKKLMDMETKREKCECWFESLESRIDSISGLLKKEYLVDIKNQIEERKRPFILVKPVIKKAIEMNKVIEKYQWPKCVDGSMEGFSTHYKIMEELKIIKKS